MIRNAAAVMMLACAACPSKAPQQTGLGSGGSGQPPGQGSGIAAGGAARCEALRGKLEGLYRAEAQLKEPERVEAATADNTQMVLAECARDPDRVVPCVEREATVPSIETKCLTALDEEGTEGEALRK